MTSGTASLRGDHQAGSRRTQDGTQNVPSGMNSPDVVQIRVLQWNVWMDEDPKRILGVLREIDADILCLQEVVSSRPWHELLLDPLARELGYFGRFAVAHTLARGNGLLARGNAVFGRRQPTAVREVRLRAYTNRVSQDELQGRIYVEATFPFDVPIIAGSAHLSYVPRFEMPPWKQAESVRLFNTVRQHKRRALIGADLNAGPDSPGVELMRTHFCDAGPPATVPTWTTKPYSDPSFTETRLAWRLDYVFVTPDIRVVEARVIETDVSDHLPILITAQYRTRPAGATP